MSDNSDPKFIIVIGASAGGLHSVIELCAQLTDEVNAAVFVVLHVSNISMSDVLTLRIEKNTSFRCKVATHEEPIRRGMIYLAQPDKHLMMREGHILVGGGPPENRWRPSIDVLFRSAAASYGSRVIGIVLSGLLQDGTAGMLAIKKSGGTGIVQDPKQAEYPDMPQSVLDHVEVDYCLPLEQMGAVLIEKSKTSLPEKATIPADVLAEAAIAERVMLGIELVKPLGDRSDYSCPDCGGALYEIKDQELTRYRCHTGHVYNANELLLKMDQSLENSLWIALRMLEERRSLLKKISKEEESKGWIRSAAIKKERADELEVHIQRLKNLLFEARDDVKSEGIKKAG